MEKRSSKIKKIAIYSTLAISSFLIIAIIFSPFFKHEGFEGKQILHTVTINAPVDTVFNYLGNSDNAQNWSVYVDHITTTNAEKIPDGEVGSERRCFVETDETGIIWDERTTEVVPNIKRQLVIYNLQGLPMIADNLATEQLYTKINEKQTKLSFTLFYKNNRPTYWETFKTYLAAYRIKAIFKQNMDNIKAIIEGG